ncbi:MurR/RpiR family transcriptional regulator [Tropicimonas sp. IMCC34043]|uniref:MurR/RpiR family transcriptional regulator n=1 Tax=Tropicimonas sp. IMCC34043 TaxID=2248760 RepID=UPI000E2573CE|nr:MurR/RpiR family transcriptional regulator [Tropicimonas sp. IMCC34043]
MTRIIVAPDTVEGFEHRLNEISGDLPKRMRQCAEYLSAHSDRIAVSTVAQIAEAAGVPPSAMMRFCQLLGFSGYSEMQRLFRDAFSPRLPDYATRLDNLRRRGAGSPASLLAEFVDVGHKSLELLVNSVDPRALDEAVSVLSEAPLIHIVGFRRAFSVASYLAYAFEKMEIPAILHDGTGNLDHRHAMRQGDVVIAITFSPYSTETIAMSQEAIDRGLSVIAITDFGTSPLRLPGVIALSVSEIDVGAFRSLSATLSLATALAVAIGTRRAAV